MLLKNRLAVAVTMASALSSGALTAAELSGEVAVGADGTALEGVIVEVIETGESTTTDRAGRFRFEDLSTGSYTVRFRSLGFKTQQQKVQVLEQDTPLLDVKLAQIRANDVEEIIVRGTAMGINRSLSQMRMADNTVNVISADALGKFPDNNLAESVSRMPGVTLVRDQKTGEGAFVTIRGLDARLNVYTVNGVRISASDQSSRGIDLSQLTADGLASVSIAKTLTPDMDGDAIGGTVDLRTPSGFDYGDQTLMLSLTGSYNDRSETDSYDYSAAYGDVFADNRFAVYASVYGQDRNNVGQESENEGDWLPYLRPGSDQDLTVDPQSLQMQGLGLDLYENELERMGGNFSIDFRATQDDEFHFRGQFSRFTKREDHHYVDVQNDDEEPTLDQVDPSRSDLPQPNANVVGFDPDLGRIYGYSVDDIVDDDGDGLITDADRRNPNRDDDGFYTLGGQSGIWDPRRILIQRGADFKEEEESLINLSVGGKHRRGNWSLSWDTAYSYGEFERPYDYDFDFDDTTPQQRQSPFTDAGVRWSFPEAQYPQWNLTPEQQVAYFDPASFQWDGANGDYENHSEENLLAQADVEYRFNNTGPWQSAKFGAKYIGRTHETDEDQLFNADRVSGVFLSDRPDLIAQERYGDFLSGRYSGSDDFGFIFDRAAALQAIRTCDPVLFESCEGFEEELGADTISKEDVFSAYAMANLQFGDLTAILGVRVEHTEVSNDYYSFQSFDARLADGTEFGEIETTERGSDESSYTNVLPSLTLVYRPNDNWVYRGALWTSIARPEFGDISSEEDVSADVIVDENGNILEIADGSVSISRGNPGLEPAESLNFDLGVEYYSPNGGLAAINAFYKDIDNFIFSDFAREGSVPSQFEGVDVEVESITNGAGASIMGVELTLTQQFTALPEPWDGFGISANATFQESKADPGDDWRSETDFINAPSSQYNAQLFFERYGLQARLSYQYTDRYLEDLRDYGINKWINDWDRLDMQIRYTFDSGVAIRFEGQNLLDTHNYWAIRGENGDSFQKDYVENGRVFFLGIDYRF